MLAAAGTASADADALCDEDCNRAAVTYELTGSYAAAVIAATIGATGRSWPMRVLVANGLAARSIAVEFGPAEAIDSITIRPIALYLGPLVVGNMAVGFVLGSIVADIAFYVMPSSATSASRDC